MRQQRYSSRGSPGPPCSSCWSQPGVPTRRLPTVPAAHLAALLSGRGRGCEIPPNSASITPPSGKPLPHPSAAALAAQRWAPSLCSAPGRWPLWSGGPCSLSEGPRQTWVKVEATAGHRRTQADTVSPSPLPRQEGQGTLTAHDHSPPKTSGCAPPGGTAAAAVGEGGCMGTGASQGVTATTSQAPDSVTYR